MAAIATASTTLSPACPNIHFCSNAHERAYASGPASTSSGFSPLPLRQQTDSRSKLSQQNSLHTLTSSSQFCNPYRSKLHREVERKHREGQSRSGVVKAQGVKAGVLDRPGGAGVLEKPPALDTSWLEKLYQTESGGEGSKEKQNKRTGGGDQFRVLLVDSPKHTEKRVTNVLPKVIPNLSSEAARGIFEESKVQGFGIVTVCVKEYAETYCQLLIRNGLSSRIEPDADTL